MNREEITMKKYRVWRAKGEFRILKRKYTFNKEIVADKESHVRERILSEIGSRHRLSRRYINILEIKEIKPQEVKDLELRKALSGERTP